MPKVKAAILSARQQWLEAIAFHPRAVKLLRKQKNFLVVAEDEPYFMQVYDLIRKHEMDKSTWTQYDEMCYQDAKLSSNK